MKKILLVLLLMNVSWIVRLFFEKNSDCIELSATTAFAVFAILLSEITLGKKVLWRSLALFLIGFYLFFQYCYDAFFIVTGKELTFLMLNNFDVGVGFLLFGKWILLGLGLYVLVLSSIGLCLFLFHEDKQKSPNVVSRIVVLTIALVFAMHFTPVFSPFWQKVKRTPGAYPEIVFRNAGIKFSDVTRDKVVATSGKNVVVIFMESIENTFTYTKTLPGLTPNLTAFEKEGLSFTGISNGLNADYSYTALYSAFMGMPLLEEQSNTDQLWQRGTQDRYGKDLPSMPFIFHKAGYAQTFLQGPSLKFAGMDMLLRREKIDHPISYADSEIPEPESWGCSDRRLFEWGFTHFEKLSSSKKTFVLYLATIDTHLPSGFMHKDSADYDWPDDKERYYLRTVKTTDREIGKFIAKLKKTKAWKNTVVVIVTDHFLFSSHVDALLAKNQNRHHVGIVLNAERKGIVDAPGAQMDWGPTILSVAGVKHNYTFPVGEDLTSKTNPARLEKTERQKELIFCFLATHETRLEKTPITVSNDPVWALKYNGRTFPFYTGRETYSQDKNSITFIPLSMNREPEAFVSGDRPIGSCAIENKEYLAFGYTNGCIQKLFTDVTLPRDQWCLAHFVNGKRSYACSADVNKLKLNWLSN